MWSIIDWIHKLKVLALLIKGGYDEAQESVMQPFLSFSPFFGPDCEVKWAEFGQSSRILQLEELEEGLKVVGSFLVLE